MNITPILERRKIHLSGSIPKVRKEAIFHGPAFCKKRKSETIYRIRK